jgi:hypothetical protein
MIYQAVDQKTQITSGRLNKADHQKCRRFAIRAQRDSIWRRAGKR